MGRRINLWWNIIIIIIIINIIIIIKKRRQKRNVWIVIVNVTSIWLVQRVGNGVVPKISGNLSVGGEMAMVGVIVVAVTVIASRRNRKVGSMSLSNVDIWCVSSIWLERINVGGLMLEISGNLSEGETVATAGVMMDVVSAGR